MNHFFIKLIPPRPTFPRDMSADERMLMQSHAIYLKKLQDQGVVLVYGPVQDANGAWGLAILECETEEQARGYMDNDPTVKAHLNRYEIAPMTAIVKKAVGSEQ
jgi:uncharacterized protein